MIPIFCFPFVVVAVICPLFHGQRRRRQQQHCSLYSLAFYRVKTTQDWIQNCGTADKKLRSQEPTQRSVRYHHYHQQQWQQLPLSTMLYPQTNAVVFAAAVISAAVVGASVCSAAVNEPYRSKNARMKRSSSNGAHSSWGYFCLDPRKAIQQR
jgi:hypothetical protein